MVSSPEAYWERAGEVGYTKTMFADNDVEHHVNQRVWDMAISMSHELGASKESHIMDLGCGDGTFTNSILAKQFANVDGYDLSKASIKRATEHAPANVRYFNTDITRMDYNALPQYDAVFMIGILHHVKVAAPQVLKGLRNRSKIFIIAEPNGNHVVRKALEFTPMYKAAGEDSFRTGQMERILADAGYAKKLWKRVNLFPNFTPKAIFHGFRPLEPIVEKTPILRALCTLNLWGYVAE